MAKKLIHEILPVGMLQCNCSILGDPETREAIVIDPGDEVARILAAITKYDLKVRAILNTHAHIDHVGGLRKVHEATGAPVFMHRDDLDLHHHLDRQAQWLGIRPPAMTEVDQFLREGDTVRWGGYEARVLHTPGHTQGSVSLFLPFEESAREQMVRKAEAGDEAPWVFAGDTLFAGSIGRTDLWGGSMPAILNSIQEKLLALPDETIVFPGHGPATTIGEERETNPFLT
jgi:glyoxylase-like metal-dependent hydrolase (beta-lactamase superfamily II)